MISLKKYLDMRFEATRTAEPVANDLLDAALQSYRSSLVDMGNSGYQACPAFGASLQQSLFGLTTQLTGTVSAKALEETCSQVSERLSQWGERST